MCIRDRETTEAQVQSAQALYDKAADQLKAGLSPAIDALRSQVELQTRQQQLIVARNDLAKMRLNVARMIGLPPGQEFVLTEKAPYQALAPLPLDTYLQRAYAGRADYQAALAQVRAAELSRKAASAGHYPSLDIDANFGDVGVTPAHSNGTWQVDGGINIPIFAGNRTHSEVLQADAQLKQARSQLGDLRGRIDYEVRTALLDLNAAADQVAVARSSVDLAERGGNLKKMASVASFFISRIDTLVDSKLEEKTKATTDAKQQAFLKDLLGKIAIANGKLTYQRYQKIFSGPRWQALAAKGAQTQRVLWASTSTKNPAYRDVIYVEELIGADTVNTMPPATVDAFRDHGKLRNSLTEDVPAAAKVMDDLERAGISIKEVTDKLTQDGVKLFADAFDLSLIHI